ncbi:UDP-N-acetylmuramoyl-tripeptide--D-alanyl-D-alanine ligase [Halanaerobium saccharolyticum]|uniref:UDP-N-acetylmuramoyl-tripeptide--D-alanyl-D-alanine ligase n=1 Tax=Halanaerobium saccharolyticum TaxID=43595 RepID=A0A4R6LHI3_9FIRM|nr:UDP-N-acetylmuramoyl-tripeptide--D-alanyl-D-alanine ligase [Halanaerobium saccharolyticum]TDO83438.1 UDP-N-acetylmuramoyl-tripeptide--D-alanyl-D-alanine ligase [Halanaerobium saccharolyticum]
MERLSLNKIIKFSGAELLQGTGEQIIEEIVIDSREVKKNYLFIAIIGENQDGHIYLEDAVNNGAGAVIVDREIESDFLKNSEVAVLKVADTTRALQDIAHNYRKTFADLKVVAVTGSAGKTTTKDLIYSVLSQKYNCLKTEGNYNNHLGLPLTLLRLTAEKEIAVLEMGMSALGEIELLAKIAVPDFGIVTNVAAAHLKQLGSLENIAQAKKELIDQLKESDTAVLNYDNYYTRKMGETTAAEVIYFGFETGADLQTIDYSFDKNKEILNFKVKYGDEVYNFKFNKAGKHNIYNVMTALITAFKLKLGLSEIQQGLLKTKFSSNRMEFVELNNGSRIINDSYNANPLAVKAALDVLFELKAERKIAVLASMLELGSESKVKHQEIGAYAAEKEVDLLITIGSKAKDIAAGAESKMQTEKLIILNDNQECIDFLAAEIKTDDLILIKGSRANKLEEIAAELKNKEL